MSNTETPGVHLSRLRVQWSERFCIERDETGYVARDRRSALTIHTANLGALEG